MQVNDLTRARRRLKQLERRKFISRVASAAMASYGGMYTCEKCRKDYLTCTQGMHSISCGGKIDVCTWNQTQKLEARRMAREYAAQIKEQKLQIRWIAANVSDRWRLVEVDSTYVTVYPAGDASRLTVFDGPRAKARAVAYAEKMNRKEVGK